jgi:hypothetical protein
MAQIPPHLSDSEHLDAIAELEKINRRRTERAAEAVRRHLESTQAGQPPASGDAQGGDSAS